MTREDHAGIMGLLSTYGKVMYLAGKSDSVDGPDPMLVERAQEIALVIQEFLLKDVEEVA